MKNEPVDLICWKCHEGIAQTDLTAITIRGPIHDTCVGKPTKPKPTMLGAVVLGGS